MKVIITEKPSVARDIARVLNVKQQKEGYIEGNGYIITWALGHLIELCQPDEYDESLKQWNMETLPIIPEIFKTKIIERSANQFNIIKSLLQSEKINEVICATDAGREGELIFRLIYNESKCTVPIKRLWISSQTDTAIKEGFEKLKPGDDYNGLYDSAKSRSEADWIVGINATRAYSIKFSRGHGVMSVGRVQTPVLKLIVDRYRSHTQFESKTFYEILADINHEKGNFTAIYTHDKNERLENKEKAETIKQEIESTPEGKILSCSKKLIREKQPLLYDLTELQKDANKRFSFSADSTLKIMQSLYEKHKILSYPRTSSRYISTDVAEKLPLYLSKLAGLTPFKDALTTIKTQNYTLASRIIDNKKVTDHHAIIPTDKTPNLNLLSAQEKDIYLMVIRRFLAAYFPECEKAQSEIITQFGQHKLKANGTIITKEGWRALYTEQYNNTKKSTKKEVELPNVTENDAVTHKKITLKKGQTKAPPLYTEASILAAMETAGKNIEDEELRQAMKDCGLGTPATRAQILEKLLHVNYIIRDKNKLSPTAKGEYIIDSIQDEALLSAELTGNWEKELNNMAQNNAKRSDFMANIINFTKRIVKCVTESNHYAIRADQTVYGNCPVCKQGKIIESKQAYGCSHWKSNNCGFAIWKTIAKKNISESMVKTLLKNGKTAILKGFTSKQGNKFDAALEISDGKVSMSFEQDTIGDCPLCDGKIVESPKAYSCNKWRDNGCKSVIWKEIAKRKISKIEAKLLVGTGKIENVDGFKTKTGKPFSAGLYFEKGRVSFDPR